MYAVTWTSKKPPSFWSPAMRTAFFLPFRLRVAATTLSWVDAVASAGNAKPNAAVNAVTAMKRRRHDGFTIPPCSGSVAGLLGRVVLGAGTPLDDLDVLAAGVGHGPDEPERLLLHLTDELGADLLQVGG